jgi:argininosuccinate lyase
MCHRRIHGTEDCKKKANPNTMWGGRYSLGPAEIMEKINASIGFDRKLYAQDIAGSLAHADMLVAQGILTAKDGRAIKQGLAGQGRDRERQVQVLDQARGHPFQRRARLTDLIGPAGGRLHTGRSRNDQVALDVRLWTRDTVDRLEAMLCDLQEALIDRAEEYASTIMPGFTHLQTAQPITFGHHLLAYVEMVGRDRSRLRDCRERMNESPLGAAALAGTPHPIDRKHTATGAGLRRADGQLARCRVRPRLCRRVPRRGVAVRGASVATRRGDRDLVLGTVPLHRLSDAFTTGSSIMPQKRNPDAAELTRGKVGRIVGAFVALCTMLKGLPLTYGKDMQEDKEPLFDAADSIELCVAAMTGMVRDLKANPERMRAVASADYSVATDLADWLVREVGLPFRQAHHATGALVGKAAAKGVDLDKLSLAEMQAVEPSITRTSIAC